MRRLIAAVIIIAGTYVEIHAQSRPEFRVPRVAEPPRIDGVLNDDVWQREPLPLGDWIAYNPVRGGRMEQRTDVRIAYDDRFIYFAFQCFDNEPDKIRTTISRRDTAFNDDWIAISLDSAGTGQKPIICSSIPRVRSGARMRPAELSRHRFAEHHRTCLA